MLTTLFVAGNATSCRIPEMICKLRFYILRQCSGNAGCAGQPAQQESCVTSLKKVCAQSFKPSTIVR